MEAVSTKVYKGLKAYWKRRGYERLTSTGRRRKTTSPSAELGTGNRKRRWRLKISPKLKLRFFSPKKIFTGIRDGYVNMMLRLANSRAVGVSGFGFGGDDCFVTRPVKEYDEKMLVELYKSIMMSRGHLVPRDVGRIESKMECAPTTVTLVN